MQRSFNSPKMEMLYSSDLNTKQTPVSQFSPQMRSTPVSSSKRNQNYEKVKNIYQNENISTRNPSADDNVASLVVFNEQMRRENEMLRERLHISKANANLRAANVIAEITTWLDRSSSYCDEQQCKCCMPKSCQVNSTQTDINASKAKTSTENTNNEIKAPVMSLFGTKNESPSSFANSKFPQNPQSTGQQTRSNAFQNYGSNEMLNLQPSTGFQSPMNNSEQPPPHKGHISYGSDIDSDDDSDGNRKHGHTWENPNSTKFRPVTPPPKRDLSPDSRRNKTPEAVRGPDKSQYSYYQKNDQQTTMLKPETGYSHQASTSFPQYERSSFGYSHPSNTMPINAKYEQQQQPLQPHQQQPEFQNYSVTPTVRNTRSPAQDPEYLATLQHSLDLPFGSQMKDSYNNNSMQKSMKVKPTTRLIGEICFQLDRKILNYVFKTEETKRRRFYGYIIQNIDEKINKESRDRKTGQTDENKKYLLNYRYQYILNVLKPMGYDVNFHPDFCADMVNKYGLLPLPPDRSTTDGIKPEQKDLILDTLMKIAPQNERDDIQVILDCLTLLAQHDGSAIISF